MVTLSAPDWPGLCGLLLAVTLSAIGADALRHIDGFSASWDGSNATVYGQSIIC